LTWYTWTWLYMTWSHIYDLTHWRDTHEHDSIWLGVTYMTWLIDVIHMNMTLYDLEWHIWLDSLTWYIWTWLYMTLSHIYDLTHWHDTHEHDSIWLSVALFAYIGSFTYLTWLIDMTHSYTGHDSLIHGTWLTHTRDMTHSYTGHAYMNLYDFTYTCE